MEHKTNPHIILMTIAVLLILVGLLPEPETIAAGHDHSGYMMKESTARSFLASHTVPDDCYDNLLHYLQYGEEQFVRTSCLVHIHINR